MHTEKYLTLQRRLVRLREIYLPQVFSPTGEYNDIDYEKVLAYTVLSHAEMEYYFEETALAIAQKAYNRWTRSKKASTPLLALVAYYTGQYQALPESHDGNRSGEDINARINKAYSEYNSQIRVSNHGIKEKNLLGIFLPIGIEVSEFDENMLIALNNFGATRGRIAHSTRAGQLISPSDALNDVNNIMTYIDPFDSLLSAYKKSIR